MARSIPRRRRERQTWQRSAIIRVVEAAGCHLTAEEIHRRVRRAGRPVGLATVYRALEAFAREGVVEPLYIGDGRVRYGSATRHHDHLVCLDCGRWQPLRACARPRLPSGHKADFQVLGHRVEFYGRCARCRPAVS